MKNLFKKTGQKIVALLMMLLASFATLAAGSYGSDFKISTSVSSLNGIKISGLVAILIFLIIVLSARGAGRQTIIKKTVK